MIEAIEGIIINEIPYGETSKIINVFTKEHGIIGVICKGAKGPKSHFKAITTRFTFGIFNMYFKKEKLSTLISVDVINDLKEIKKDIVLMGYLSYLTELATQVYKQNDSNEIYNLYIKTIIKMNDKINPGILTNILELKLLDYLGISLELNKCVKCGNSSVVTISFNSGGYVCAKCRTNEEIVDQKIIKMIKMYYYVEIDSITKIDISYDVSKKIDIMLNDFYDTYTGLYLNSKKFLDKIVHS